VTGSGLRAPVADAPRPALPAARRGVGSPSYLLFRTDVLPPRATTGLVDLRLQRVRPGASADPPFLDADAAFQDLAHPVHLGAIVKLPGGVHVKAAAKEAPECTECICFRAKPS